MGIFDKILHSNTAFMLFLCCFVRSRILLVYIRCRCCRRMLYRMLTLLPVAQPNALGARGAAQRAN